MAQFDEAMFLECVKAMMAEVQKPTPDYVIGIFDGKLGYAARLDEWEPWGVSRSGLPIFKSKRAHERSHQIRK